jgi:hypothetical protein
MAADFFDDLVDKKVFLDMIEAKYPTQSAIFATGAVYIDPNPPLNLGIFSYTPFMKEPTGNWQAPVYDTNLVSERLTMGEIDMINFTRQKSFYITRMELQRIGINYDNETAAANAVDNLAGLSSKYIAKQKDRLWYKILNGVFATTLLSTHVADYSAQSIISLDDIFAAKAKIGESSEYLNTHLGHSDVRDDWRKRLLLDYLEVTDYSSPIIKTGVVPFTAGMNFKASNISGLEAVSDIYRSYLLSPNCLYYANSFNAVDLKWDPELGGGSLKIIFTLNQVFAVPYVSYVTTVGKNPSDTDLETGTTWSYVGDNVANTPIVQILSKRMAGG